MRRQSIVASAVLTAVLVLVALPGVAGSQAASRMRPMQAEAIQPVRLPGSTSGSPVVTHLHGAAGESAGHLDGTTSVSEPGNSSAPTERTAGVQAVTWLHPVVAPKPRAPVKAHLAVKKFAPQASWKRVMTGLASWYDNGTTAMRLPRGTHVKICGARGCVVRVVSDWGPARHLSQRIVDLTPQDFVAVTGRSLSAGLAQVKVYIL